MTGGGEWTRCLSRPDARKKPPAIRKEAVKLCVDSKTAPAMGGPRTAAVPRNMVIRPKEVVSLSIPTRSTRMTEVVEM